MNICSSGKGVYYLNCQWHIQKKFGDNVISWAFGLLSSIPAKFYSFIFCTLLATFFLAIQRSFEQKTKRFIVYLRNLSENNDFLFLFIFGNIFWGAHNIWTLPFSVWIQVWLYIRSKKLYDVNLCINWES